MASADNIRAGKAVVEVEADNSKLKKGLKESEGLLKGIKSKLGEESQFGLAVKTLAGAGAVAGIGMITSKLEAATGSMRGLVTSLREGQIGYSDFVKDMVKSIPIIGDIAGAIDNVGEIITGNAAKAAAIRAAQANARQTIDSSGMVGGGYSVNAAEKRARDIEANLNLKNQSPLEQARINAASPFTDRIFAINEERDAAIKALQEKNQKQMDELRAVTIDPKSSMIQKTEANSKLEEIKENIEKEIGRIRKAAAMEIAANEKAKAAAIGGAEKDFEEKQKEAVKVAGDYVANMMKGFSGFVLGGGGPDKPQQIAEKAKQAVMQSMSIPTVSGYGGDLGGIASSGLQSNVANIVTLLKAAVQKLDGSGATVAS